jgi:hypothetical protein
MVQNLVIAHTHRARARLQFRRSKRQPLDARPPSFK